MKRVLIEEEAERELHGSVDFYESRCAGLGLDFGNAARKAVDLIQSDPERQAPLKDKTSNL